MKKNHFVITELTSKYLDAFVAFRKESAKESEWVNSVSEDKAKGLIKEYGESKNKRAFIAIGENDDEIAGQLLMTSSVASGDASFISLISVRNKCKGTGLGRRLLNKAVSVAKEEKTKKVQLVVHSKNTAAIGFYEKFGFVRSEHGGKYNLIYEYEIKDEK